MDDSRTCSSGRESRIGAAAVPASAPALSIHDEGCETTASRDSSTRRENTLLIGPRKAILPIGGLGPCIGLAIPHRVQHRSRLHRPMPQEPRTRFSGRRRGDSSPSVRSAPNRLGRFHCMATRRRTLPQNPAHPPSQDHGRRGYNHGAGETSLEFPVPRSPPAATLILP